MSKVAPFLLICSLIFWRIFRLNILGIVLNICFVFVNNIFEYFFGVCYG